jgi:hypothetical protein
MKFSKSKTTTTAIALSLIFAMAFSLVALPVANAQVNTKASYAFIGATPNPVGVGQETLLHIGVLEGMVATTDGWEGLTVTVEKPDGTTETLGPYRTDATGGTGDIYLPTMEGTYYLQTHFPAQDFTWPPGAMGSPVPEGGVVHYKADDSDKLALNVTAEPVEYYPSMPLPTEYWTRPIDSQLREWSPIAGNWVDPYMSGSFRFAPYNDAPETAHILWTKPLAMPGLAGGATGDKGFETGDAYEGFFSAGGMMGGQTVIIGGRLYYNLYKYNGGTGVEQDVVCVDLHTGEELWVRNWNNTRLAWGQTVYWGSWNYMGVFPFLWTTEGGAGMFGPPTPEIWNAYDAFTGRWVYRIENLPPGTNLYGPNGEICRYYVDLENGWMMKWNSTRVVSTGGSFGSEYMGYTFNVSMYDWDTRPPPQPPGFSVTAPTTNGYEWNKTIPKGLPGSVVATFLDDRIIGSNLASSLSGAMAPPEVVFWGINLNSSKGTIGALLFNETWSPPTEWITGNLSIGIEGGQVPTIASSSEDKVAILWTKETRQHYGVSLETGELIWGPTVSQPYLDAWEGTQIITHLIAYGRLYSAGVGGILYCFNVTTGELLWTYEAKQPYTENLFSSNWWIGATFISDGKIYLGHSEHSPNMPLPRGAPFICVNATSGEEIWRIDGAFRQTGWGGIAVIGDSIIATMDTYDQRIYAIGKGPSATTVTAPDIGVPMGKSVLIRGTVTDISPGTAEYALTARFPNGVPAVADENMSDWMLYVYKQFPRPADVAGVEVTLDVLDSNGNYRNIGTATSDANGAFSFVWEPDIPGKYTVYATFAGSESYWSSSAETAFNVEEAPAATPEPTPMPASAADLYFVPATTGIIIAIAVVGAILILMLRKR